MHDRAPREHLRVGSRNMPPAAPFSAAAATAPRPRTCCRSPGRWCGTAAAPSPSPPPLPPPRSWSSSTTAASTVHCEPRGFTLSGRPPGRSPAPPRRRSGKCLSSSHLGGSAIFIRYKIEDTLLQLQRREGEKRREERGKKGVNEGQHTLSSSASASSSSYPPRPGAGPARSRVGLLSFALIPSARWRMEGQS